MRIKRIEIQNFRNFRHCVVELQRHAVVVGENKIGKSNFLHALRLIFDSRLSEAERRLRLEDFHDRVPRERDSAIHIKVDLTDFEDDADALAVLSDYAVDRAPALVSRLNYLYRPNPTLARDPEKEDDYEFVTFGADDPNRNFGHEVRQQIALTFLPALRDAESDLGNWRRSPLRPLLESVAARLDRAEIERAVASMTDAAHAVAELPHIRELADRLQRRLIETIGAHHSVALNLGFAPADGEKLIRALRLFIDGGTRPLSEASLGSANLIYLSLWMLELERQISENNTSHNILAIEEPEAHLHPHLQRLIFRNFLRARRAPPVSAAAAAAEPTPAPEKNETILLTTHSPHIVSVAPLDSLVVLRKSADGMATEAVSTFSLPVTPAEKEDLERYLDVTRGEIVFAKAILLVEGSAEEYVVPALGSLLGFDFDRLGITVCSVNGTDFAPYVKLLGLRGLNIPFAVVTDRDPFVARNDGISRARILLRAITGEDVFDAAEPAAIVAESASRGIFVNEHTLEVDLFRAGQKAAVCHTITELSTNGAAQQRAAARLAGDYVLEGEVEINRFLDDIEEIGKGRFAQRLAANLVPDFCPQYIRGAIQYVISRINTAA